MSFLLRIFCLMILLLSGGCSRMQIAYDWADTIVLASLDRYFDLTNVQKDAIRPKIRDDLRTILKEDIPEACLYFEDFVKMVEKKDVKKEDILSYEERGEVLFLKALKKLEPNTQAFVQILTPKQFEYYQKKIRQMIDEENERFKSKEKQRDETERRIEAQFDLVGLDLYREQRKMLQEFLDQFSEFPVALEKKSRQGNIERFLVAAKNPAELKKFIFELFQDPLSLRTPEYKKSYADYYSKLVDLKVKILNSLRDEQRTEIKEKVQKMVKQLRDLRVHEGFPP